jgi:hypothetical protein
LAVALVFNPCLMQLQAAVLVEELEVELVLDQEHQGKEIMAAQP